MAKAKAAKAKAAKAKAAPKAETKPDGEDKRGRKSRYDPKAKIKLITKENPKREGTKAFTKFANYRTGMSVEEALCTELTSRSLAYDEGKGFISIG